MRIIFLDSETTGLDVTKHRLLEIAFKIFDSEKKRLVSSFEAIINQPAAVLACADPHSMSINGITEEVILTGKSERAVSAEIMNDFERAGVANGAAVFICQNPSFDRGFFNQLISVEMQKELQWPYHWLDLASMFWAIKKGSFEKESDISKNAIAQSFGLKKEADPHRAMNGVIHLMQCYQALLGLSIPEFEASARSVR